MIKFITNAYKYMIYGINQNTRSGKCFQEYYDYFKNIELDPKTSVLFHDAVKYIPEKIRLLLLDVLKYWAKERGEDFAREITEKIFDFIRNKK